MKTFTEVADEYNKQSKAGKINYEEIRSQIMEAAKNAFPEFSEARLKYIWSRVYDDYHSHFGDCIWEMEGMCYFVRNMPE